MPVVNMLPDPGGTPKSGVKKVYSNPPFDARITKIPMLQYSLYGGTDKLYRGYITDQTPARTSGNFYKLNFLYNPSTVSENRSIDANNQGILPQYARADDPTPTPLLPLNASVSFSLLFDRTFEMWDMSYHGSNVGSMGVLADVLILFGMVGITQVTNGSVDTSKPITVPGPGGANLNVDSLTGVMQYIPVYTYFGSAWASSYNNLKYYGYINSIGVTWTHWSQDMIPMRCGVSISMTLLPPMIKTANSTTSTDTSSNPPTGKTPVVPRDDLNTNTT